MGSSLGQFILIGSANFGAFSASICVIPPSVALRCSPDNRGKGLANLFRLGKEGDSRKSHQLAKFC